MATAFDVAAYILAKQGPMTAMKLQKLVYYSHAWHLVWDETRLFTEPIEAWANGPVIRQLYNRHRGRFHLDRTDTLGGDASKLKANERETVDAVLEFYGDKSAHWLSELTHREQPWQQAREEARLDADERGNAVISDASMFEYYDSLTSTTADGE